MRAQEIKFPQISGFFFFHYISFYYSLSRVFSLSVPQTHANTHTRALHVHTLNSHLFSLVFSSSPSRIGEQMSAEGINEKETGLHTGSDSRCDLLNLPLFQ